METVVVAQHRNQYYIRGGSQISGGLISSPSRGFKGINCRIFQSSTGILASPGVVLPAFDTPPTKKNLSSYSEPSKQCGRSNPIPIASRPTSRRETLFSDDIMCSELWAGPTYSNSPPPSSLPIPKFSLRQKRSVSFELPISDSGIKVLAMSNSAPSSPTRELSPSPSNDLCFTDAYATENLRRILHLDAVDD